MRSLLFVIALSFAPNAFAQLEAPLYRDDGSQTKLAYTLQTQGLRLNAGVDIPLDSDELSAIVYGHTNVRNKTSGFGAGLLIRPLHNDWLFTDIRAHGGPLLGLSPTDTSIAIRLSQSTGFHIGAFDVFAGPKIDLATSFTSKDARLRALLITGAGYNLRREDIQRLSFHVMAELGNTFAARGSAIHATLGISLTLYQGLFR